MQKAKMQLEKEMPGLTQFTKGLSGLRYGNFSRFKIGSGSHTRPTMPKLCTCETFKNGGSDAPSSNPDIDTAESIPSPETAISETREGGPGGYTPRPLPRVPKKAKRWRPARYVKLIYHDQKDALGRPS